MLIARHMGMNAIYVFRTGQEFFLVSYRHCSILAVIFLDRVGENIRKYSKLELNSGIRHFLNTKK
jgi:hypothetical protein